MKKTTFNLFALVVLSLSSVFQMHAQTAEEVVNKYFAAVGGKDKMAVIKTMKSNVKVAMGPMEFEANLTQMVPNKMFLSVDVMGKTIQQAFDGKEGWSVNPFATGDAPQKNDAETNEEMSHNRFPNELIDYEIRESKIAYDGVEEIEGAKCHKIKLIEKDGREKYFLFDTETAVLIMERSFPQSGDAKGTTMETLFSDYQEAEGIMFPFSITMKYNGEVGQSMIITKVEINPEVNEKVFMFPGQ